MFERLSNAIAFAATAHAGQVRKYDGLPYVTHPIAVMRLIYETLPIVTEDELIGAVLHDTVEDTGVSLREIERRYGETATSIVYDLTDQFTPKAYPHLNRKARKEMECARLADISEQAQNIKVADLIDNSTSILAHDLGFARIYLPEKKAVLSVLTKAHPDLRLIADRQLTKAFSILELEELKNEGLT